MTDIRTLIERVLASPGNLELLAEVRRHASEIIEHLDELDSLEDWEKRVSEQEPLWLAEVLAALAGDEKLPEEDDATLTALFEANAADESAIGYAFKEGLLRGLPERLADLGGWLRELPEIETQDQEDLLRTPSVEAARPVSENLVLFGVTPLTVFHATEAVTGLTERLGRRKASSRSDSVIFDPSSPPTAGDGSFVLPLEAVLTEIQHRAECTRPVAMKLCPWLAEVAQFKPFVFRNFQASPLRTAVKLTRILEDDEELYVRWGLAADVSAGAAYA